MVLPPEIVDAVGPDVAVLGAGGIGTGRQVAEVMADLLSGFEDAVNRLDEIRSS